MKNRRRSIKSILILSTSALTGIGLITISVFIMTQSSSIYKDQAIQSVKNEAIAEANKFQDKINPIILKAKGLEYTFISAVDNPVENNRERLWAENKHFFSDSDQILAFNQWIMVVPGYIDEYEYKDQRMDF
ncbi:MAG: hypothetical protein JXR64_07340, partial [Spirochaetales bacterium]|nr:hypothetical protein [Spirochaetales bacterium]